MGREFTLRAILLGVVLTLLFGAANAYLGLKAGMTVSASIPAAVMSMAILRGMMRTGTILENNIVQTIASAGESLAAGVIFTVPALILLGLNPSLTYIFLLSLTGGLLGVLLMVPLRKHLLEEEHERLPYPEGTACAEVLEAGEEGGRKAFQVFSGLGVGGLFKFLMSGLHLWPDKPAWLIPGFRTLLGLDLSPALLGVGYILRLRISALVFSGGLLGWFVLIPLIAHFTGTPIAREEEVFALWSRYIRYIGAGAVLAGGLVSLGRSLPVFLRVLRAAGAGLHTWVSETGDLPTPVVLGGTGLLGLALLAIPSFHLGVLGTLLTLIFAFIFVTVSAHIVGIVGSSSNPISGMTIATLLIVSVIFVKAGVTGRAGMLSALSLGAVVCIAAAIAGDTSQDLKTGFLVGATPYRQQVAEMIGVLASAVVIGWVLFILHRGYGIGSKELSAPQATLMSLVVKGVFEGTMPWVLIFTGVFIALSVELLGIRSLPFAVGLYLPLELSVSIFLGGLISRGVGESQDGVLYASGLVAGDALIGVILAILIGLGIGLPGVGIPSPILSVGAFLLLMLTLAWVARKGT